MGTPLVLRIDEAVPRRDAKHRSWHLGDRSFGGAVRPSGFAGFDEAAFVGEDDGLDSVA
jgi:hypothetical protein